MGRKHGMRTRPSVRPAGYCSNNNTIFVSGRRSLNARCHPWNNEPAKGNLGIVRAWIKNENYKATVHAKRIGSVNVVRLYVNGKHHKDFNLNSGWEGRIIRVIDKVADRRL
jgi:hypothetical protein